MQNISIVLEGEKGNLLEDSHLNFVDLMLEIYERDEDDFKWLWAIDPYQNTTFNDQQIPLIIEELNRVNFSEENQELLKQVIDFFRKIDTHRYIKLIGD